MVEAVADQPVFDHWDNDGTLVGFRFPDYTQGLNVPGYHLHFLSRNRGVGGHVTGFSTRRVKVGIDVTSQFHMALPHDVSFLDADLAKDSAEAIRKVEK
jgi:acetolactate decarboxylase